MKNILTIGLDNNLFSKKSTDSFDRQVEYAKNFKSLTIIVYTTKKFRIIKKDNLMIIPTNSKNIFLGFFDILKILKRLKNNSKYFDIVTTQDPFFLGLLGLKASKIFVAKFRPQLHIEAFSNPYWRKESILNYIQYLIGLFVIKRAEKVRVVSKRSVDYLNKSGINNNFIPVSTNFKKFKSLNKIKKDIDLIYVGRFVKQKNLFFMIDVLFEIKKKFPKIKFYLVGDGPLKVKLQNKITKLNLDENIEFCGFVQHDKLNEYYNRAKIFVLPSLYEGWGLVAIEASLAGVPVVMSNTGCAEEIIKDQESGFICRINDKEEFVNKVTKYLFDSELRVRHSDKAKEIIYNNINREELIEKWVRFLNE